ncbi:cytochrome P450 [Nocardia africana]|uniref:Cytochrome P450(BM-3) n=1 Tax=Nocardia africana TaxID=134964 RepID=A0A378X171_9NOCA|nr:cytochrome P450 [Nocardia africana]MCC3312289.1 cytochrome P450 [Nocardia africana]SUA46401.1 Cytochrome P450(BM-3) [Nocardia africana]
MRSVPAAAAPRAARFVNHSDLSARPPGPRGIPLAGVAATIVADPYRSLQRIAQTYGDVARVPIPGMNLILVSHPDHVRHIMNTRQDIYIKPPLFENVLFREAPRFHGMANGDDWRKVRRMLNPKFTERGLAPLSELMIDQIVEVVESWQRFVGGSAVNMQEELTILTMSVMLRTMFTRPVPRSTVEPLAGYFADLTAGMAISMFTSTLPPQVPRPRGRRTAEAYSAIMSYIDEMVADRRRNPIPDGDLLSMVLDAKFDDGTTPTDEHVRRELMGLIIGGYETTAAVMSWVLARLPFAPAAQAKAYAEVDALGGNRVSHADMNKLDYLRACFDEAQRLQGFPINARQALDDDEIGGYRIPKGTTVGVSGYTLHHDPRFWRDPDTFEPARFLEDDINTYAFLPFGIGPRRCLGYRMAYMVGLYTLTTAFQRYHFAVTPGWKPVPRFSFSTVVRGGVPLTLQAR